MIVTPMLTLTPPSSRLVRMVPLAGEFKTTTGATGPLTVTLTGAETCEALKLS